MPLMQLEALCHRYRCWGEISPLLTHYKGFFNSREKKKMKVFLQLFTAMTDRQQGDGRRADLSFSGGGEVIETPSIIPSILLVQDGW